VKKKSVVVRLNGGLGNQMFQYAFGRALSEKRKLPLVLNCYGLKSKLPGVTQRPYALDSFLLTDFVAVSYEPYSLKLNRFARFVPALASMLSVRFEKVSSYDVDAINDTNRIFEGYWQSYRYFGEIKHIILDEFQFRGEFCNSFIHYKSEINKGPSVMLHVRRGDYITMASASLYHGVLGVDYYKLAVAEVLEREPQARFFVFSDDIDWCSKKMDFLPVNTLYIQPDTCRSDVQELILMSLCQYHIIANSSFSWWAAWLSDSNQYGNVGMIYAPKAWFVKQNIDQSSRFPSHWTVL